MGDQIYYIVFGHRQDLDRVVSIIYTEKSREMFARLAELDGSRPLRSHWSREVNFFFLFYFLVKRMEG